MQPARVDLDFNDGACPGYARHKSVLKVPDGVFQRGKPRQPTWYEWLFCIPVEQPAAKQCVDETVVDYTTFAGFGHDAGAKNPDPLQTVADLKFTEKVRRDYPYKKNE